MAIYGESLTIQYIAWDTVNNAPKTSDASNHTLRWVKDGTAAAPTNSPSEVDATNAPGVYKLTLTASETQCWVGTLCGKSSTSGVVIMPVTLTFERLPTAAPGSSGGLPVIGSAPLTNLDAAISSRSTLTAADVWSYATRTLSGFAFQVTVGGYTTGQSPSEQLQSLGYSSARATKLDNLDAAVSSRLAASSYIAPDNANITAIKSQTDKLSFVGSDVKATLDNEQVTVAVNNDKTGYSLTEDYDRAKTALAITEYIAPDNASISAIKTQTDKLQFDSNNYVYAVGVGGGGGTDWTDDEKKQIRYRLGIDGTTASPQSNTPHLGSTYSTLDDLASHVSTRLAASDYTAPDNDSIAAIKEVVETNLDAKVSTRLASEDYVDPDNNSISTIKQIVQDKLDEKVSSRLASSAYTAPDNESINTIKAVVQDNLDEKISSRLASQSYVAPDNDGISAIKGKTDRLRFDANDNVHATGLGGGGGVQVVVQPLVANVQRTDGDGGTITGWTYAKLVASWTISDADLSGHDLAIILYDPSDSETSLAQYHSDEITITYQSPDSLVTLSGSDSKTPSAGVYSYVIRDLTTDVILLSGRCVIRSAPDVQ